MDLDFVSVHKHALKELGQYPAILTSHSKHFTSFIFLSIDNSNIYLFNMRLLFPL